MSLIFMVLLNNDIEYIVMCLLVISKYFMKYLFKFYIKLCIVCF